MIQSGLMIKLKEVKRSVYDEIVNFAKHNKDHSYKNFKSHSQEYLSEDEYANIYWTLINTDEITEGDNAPPKKAQTDILGYLEQRVNQLEKKSQKSREPENYRGGSSFTRISEPKEDKTGLYNKYKSNESNIPEDLKLSFENDEDDVEITNDSQSAKDIFDEMNAYVSSIMQKRSTKPHLIINGAPGIGKCLGYNTEIKIQVEENVAMDLESYLRIKSQIV
jgi:hypothetical protein